MRLALICTEKLPLPAIKGGAIQIMIDGITPFLSEKFSIVIFSICDENLPHKEEQNGIQYIRFPQHDYYSYIIDYLKNESFNVIHIFNRPKIVQEIRNVSPNSAIVLSLHNDMFSPLKINPQEASQSIQLADCIATVSEYIKRSITIRYPEAKNKTFVTYSGVDMSQYPEKNSPISNKIRDDIRSTFNIGDKKVVLFVGRLSKTKGPHILIQAMNHLNNMDQDVVLLIVGGKWFSDNGVNDYVRKLYEEAKPLGNSVIFTQFIPSNQIPEFMLASDLLVCSSQWHEPLARIHYEAMASSLPIITTNRGGNNEVVFNGFNGIVIEKYQDPKSFAKTISFLLNHPELSKQFGNNGRKFIEQNFQFKHVAARYEAVYREALKRHLKPSKPFSN